jgi:hypothetical protein
MLFLSRLDFPRSFRKGYMTQNPWLTLMEEKNSLISADQRNQRPKKSFSLPLIFEE